MNQEVGGKMVCTGYSGEFLLGLPGSETRHRVIAYLQARFLVEGADNPWDMVALPYSEAILFGAHVSFNLPLRGLQLKGSPRLALDQQRHHHAVPIPAPIDPLSGLYVPRLRLQGKELVVLIDQQSGPVGLLDLQEEVITDLQHADPRPFQKLYP